MSGACAVGRGGRRARGHPQRHRRGDRGPARRAGVEQGRLHPHAHRPDAEHRDHHHFTFRITGPDGAAGHRVRRRARQAPAPDRRAPRHHRLPARAPRDGRRRHLECSAGRCPPAGPTARSPTSRRPAATAVTLGVDLAAPGDVRRRSSTRPSRTAQVDGYTVDLAGDLVPGQASPLTPDRAQGRTARDRPAALPRRLRPPGRAARRATSPTCTCTPTAPPATAPRRPARRSGSSPRCPAPGPTGCSWTSSTRGVVRTAEFTAADRPGRRHAHRRLPRPGRARRRRPRPLIAEGGPGT